MENKRQTGLLVLMSLLALCVGSSCTTEDQLHSQTSADVETTLRLKSTAAMNGKIIIREVYLKLDRVQATGNLAGNNNTDVTEPMPPEDPPFQLSKPDSSKIILTLPFRHYDQLDFHLFLFQDTYDLILRENPVAETPDPAEDHEGGSSDSGDEGEDDDKDNNNEDNENDEEDDDGNQSDDGENGEENNDDEEEDNDNNDHDDSADSKDDDGDDDKDHKDDKEKDNDKKNNDKDGDKKNDDDDDEDDDEDEEEDEDEDGRTGNAGRPIADLTHFFQNAKPGMVVIGTYENNGRIINIIFVAAGIEQITVHGRQNDSFSIALKEKNLASIIFDPEVWFDGLTPADIESAQIQNYQQQEVLFIHANFNSDLFAILSPRLEQSAYLNFDVDN